jgi:hypothetical protein
VVELELSVLEQPAASASESAVAASRARERVGQRKRFMAVSSSPEVLWQR